MLLIKVSNDGGFLESTDKPVAIVANATADKAIG